MNVEPSPLDHRARAVLLDNDRGSYTIPTSGLYPYQWNWDSVFAALGFMTFDEDRAWQELATLFEAQWPNGMVPHIVFHRDDPGYFPGPGEWNTSGLGVSVATSGISQPPIAASAVRWMLEAASNAEAAAGYVEHLFPRLMAWHRWWHAARDPDGLGVIAISHPWESGRDNLPDWDAPASAVDTSDVGEYKRRDTSHVDPHMRPSKLDYDRYMALVYFGRERGWDAGRIASESPFWVADVGVTAMLLRAERDLAALAAKLGDADAEHEINTRIGRLADGFERLWNDACGAYCSLDLRSGRHAEAPTSATLLCFYADAGTPAHRARVLQLARDWAARDNVTYLAPSFDPASPLFEHLRYWRGPVWATINFLICRGLEDIGETELAGRILADTRKLIEVTGFSEYYSAVDGSAAGGGDFTWTAAVWLAWASPTATAIRAGE